jgi:hypothetical protein
VAGNRDWNRIEAELETGFPGNRDHGRRRQPVNQSRKGPKISKTDAEWILKHIEDTDRAFGYVATCRKKPGNAVHCADYFLKRLTLLRRDIREVAFNALGYGIFRQIGDLRIRITD